MPYHHWQLHSAPWRTLALRELPEWAKHVGGSLGGGLRVDADMDLRGGHLRFENCRADGDEIITGAGGAIYVGGARALKAAPKPDS